MSWLDLRTSLVETSKTFSALLHRVEDPSAPAVGTWSVADTAAHVREVATLNSTWATGGVPPPEYRRAYELAATVSIDQVNEINALALTDAPERDLGVLAGLIQE